LAEPGRRSSGDTEPWLGDVLRERLPDGDFGGYRHAGIGIAEVPFAHAGRFHKEFASHARDGADVDEATDGANSDGSGADRTASHRRSCGFSLRPRVSHRRGLLVQIG
jgi:hypothetical protein